MASAIDRFLNFFRVQPPPMPAGLESLPELNPGDYQSRRETYPLYPLTGWDPARIVAMLESHDVGNFQASELFYHALRKEGLIASALDMRRQAVQVFNHTLQCPKDAPDEMHVFTEALARDWQSVMPDDVRGDIIERTNVFGFMVCRVQWTYKGGQRQPRLIPWTHSSLAWRQDLWCYQGISEKGLELISSDGREWVVFSLGGTRPWLRGLIRPLAFVYFGIITGDDRWLNFNDKFAEPMKVRVTPRLMREQQESQRLYAKESLMRGGDMVLCPQDPATGRGYDFRYEQVDAQGYNTLKDQLIRFDERAAIIILGHNLLQQVKGGSLAAMKGAMRLLDTKAMADGKMLMSCVEPMSKVWARANFGQNPDDFPELNGELPESKSWSLVYDFTDPEEKQAAGVRAAQFAQGFSTFMKALVGKEGIQSMAPDKVAEVLESIDLLEAAVRCGIPLRSGEESYSENGDDEAELSAEEYVKAPGYMVAAAKRSLGWVQKFGRGGTSAGRAMARKIVRGRLTRADVIHISAYWPRHEVDKQGKGWGDLHRPSNGRIAWGLWGDSGDGRGRKWSEDMAEKLRGEMDSAALEAALVTFDDGDEPRLLSSPKALPMLPPAPVESSPITLASGDPLDSAAGLIEGQQQIDAMADDDKSEAPGLAAVLAALAVAVDWSDLRTRLAGIVRGADLRDTESALRERIRTADTIGRLSVEHDLPPAARAEVDAEERRRPQADKVAEVREQQERASLIARAAAAYALYSVARHLWESASTAEAKGQPLEMSKPELGEALRSAWGTDGALWQTARAEPLQRAFTHSRVRYLQSDPLRAVYPYWRFDAVLDGRTTQLCRSLNGLTRPAGAPDFPVPPLHWHCRSTVRGIGRQEGEASEASAAAPQTVAAEPGFGSMAGYPEPEGGPAALMDAYRARVRGDAAVTLAADAPPTETPRRLPAITRRALRRTKETR